MAVFTFIPKHSHWTLLAYPVLLGTAALFVIKATYNFQAKTIAPSTYLLLLCVPAFLVWYLYVLATNRFRAVDFYENEIVFTDGFGRRRTIKAQDIKKVYPSGIVIRKKLFPISLYYLRNGYELCIYLEGWQQKQKPDA